jgi:hypothetical protein
MKFKLGRVKWRRARHGGARLKFIQIIIDLIHSKLFGAKNTSKKESNKAEIKEKKIRRNKFGFPTFD